MFILLVATVASGNVLVAGHRTVLDPGFVKDTLDDENAYESITGELSDPDGPLVPNGSEGNASQFLARVAAESVTAGFLQNQTEANVDRVYGYFHDSRSNLTVVVDTRPLIERSDDAVQRVLANSSIRELVTAFDLPLPERGPVNRSLVLSLTDGPEEYRDSRAQVRATARERIVTGLVDESFESASNDERLALVIDDYDSDNYTASEKEQLVDEREPEIRDAFRERIEREQGDEIDSQVRQRLDDSRSEVKAELAAPETGLGPEVDNASGNLTRVFVDGVLAANYSYDAFRADLDASKAELGTALGDAVQTRLRAEFGEEIRPFADSDPESEEEIQRARQAVGLADQLGIALPVLAVILIVILRLLSSWPTTALWGGIAATLGSVPLLVASQLADRFRDRITETAGGDVVTELAITMVDRVLGIFFAQSLLLLVGGLLVALVGGLVRLGALDPSDYR